MQRFTTTSHDGVTALAAYKLLPAQPPRAMVQISHGMCEYFLRYEGFAKYLAEAGFLVFGHDHLGHGSSVQDEKDLGYTQKGGGAEALIEDVHHLTLKMKKEYPNIPVILFGHSMGSFIARAVAERYPSTYAGAVFCGTCGYGLPTGMGKTLANVLMTFFGERHRSALMKKIAFGGYNKTYEKGCDPNAWLSRDAKVVDAYNADRLCGFAFTLRGYYDLFDLIERVSRDSWASKLSHKLPVLLTAGEDDPVGGYGKGVRKVAEKLRAGGHNDVTLRLYPAMRHEILNELEYETVWADLKEWIESKLA